MAVLHRAVLHEAELRGGGTDGSTGVVLQISGTREDGS